MLIFANQIASRNQSELNKAHDKSSSADERFNDMNIFIGERPIEFLFEHGINGAENKICDLDRRINNAEFFGGLFERNAEKIFIEMIDDSLTISGVAHVTAIFANVFIKTRKNFMVFAHAVFVEFIKNFLHGAADGIFICEGIIFKQSLKDWARDEMLSQHINRLFRRDVRI